MGKFIFGLVVGMVYAAHVLASEEAANTTEGK